MLVVWTGKFAAQELLELAKRSHGEVELFARRRRLDWVFVLKNHHIDVDTTFISMEYVDTI